MSAPSTIPAEEPRILSPQIPAWLNARTLLSITVVVGAAIALVLWQYAKSEKNRAESNLLLETKPGPETWTKLIRDYPGQPATALAILQSAAEASSKKDARQAAGLYEKFVREFPQHPLAGAARFAQANQLAASGDKAGAQSVYLRIMNEQPANAFRTGAAVGLARLQIQENRTEAARQVLNEILSANTGSAFIPEARALLENLPPSPTPATQLPAK
jgi:tetratricopeptide (TPR) repeat protein